MWRCNTVHFLDIWKFIPHFVNKCLPIHQPFQVKIAANEAIHHLFKVLQAKQTRSFNSQILI